MGIDPRATKGYRDNPTASPRAGEAIDVTSGDHVLTVIPTTIRAGTGGILYASLADAPAVYHTFTNISDGGSITGQFHTIRSDTTITDAVALRP